MGNFFFNSWDKVLTLKAKKQKVNGRKQKRWSSILKCRPEQQLLEMFSCNYCCTKTTYQILKAKFRTSATLKRVSFVSQCSLFIDLYALRGHLKEIWSSTTANEAWLLTFSHFWVTSVKAQGVEGINGPERKQYLWHCTTPSSLSAWQPHKQHAHTAVADARWLNSSVDME